MSNIKMTRVDARLVHGQVAARWSKFHHIKKIVLVDDKTAKDKFLLELYSIASPPGIKVLAYSEEQAVAEWGKNEFGSGPILLLFQNIGAAKRAHDAGIKFPSLNIGQATSGPDKKNVYHSVHISKAELDELISMEKNGVTVYFQTAPEEKGATLSDIARKF